LKGEKLAMPKGHVKAFNVKWCKKLKNCVYSRE